jgi:hypothetical protein
VKALFRDLACYLFGHDVDEWITNDEASYGNCKRCGRDVVIPRVDA